MVSTDSCFAESMNAQVFTTSTSALDASDGDVVAGLLDQADHHLGIDEVLRAAEGDEAYLHGDSGVRGLGIGGMGTDRNPCPQTLAPSPYGYSLFSVRAYGIASRR